MSVMLALASCGGGQPLTSTTYTFSQTITIPAGVTNLVLVSGQGAPGEPESDTYVDYYSKHTIVYNQRNDLGGQIVTLDGGTTYEYGPTPADYCDPSTSYYQNGSLNSTQTCYDFTDQSYWDTNPATTGASATGFGKTFPGGAGGPASTTSFDNVTVAANGSYSLVIPAGASITISYYP